MVTAVNTFCNLASILIRPEVVSDKIAKEVALGRMAEPFHSELLPNLQVSPLGLVPKKEPNKFQFLLVRLFLGWAFLCGL